MKHAVVTEKDLDDSIDFQEDFDLMTGYPSKKLKKQIKANKSKIEVFNKADQDISEDDEDFSDDLSEDNYSDYYAGNHEMAGFSPEDDFNVSSQSDNTESIKTDSISEKRSKKGKLQLKTLI